MAVVYTGYLKLRSQRIDAVPHIAAMCRKMLHDAFNSQWDIVYRASHQICI